MFLYIIYTYYVCIYYIICIYLYIYITAFIYYSLYSKFVYIYANRDRWHLCIIIVYVYSLLCIHPTLIQYKRFLYANIYLHCIYNQDMYILSVYNPSAINLHCGRQWIFVYGLLQSLNVSMHGWISVEYLISVYELLETPDALIPYQLQTIH